MRALTASMSMLVAVFLGIFINSVSAMGRIPHDLREYRNTAREFRGAPGPIAGAGLSAVIVAGGAYFIIRRSRRKAK